MVVCRYFTQGTCKFGDRCRFEHPNAAPNVNVFNQQVLRPSAFGGGEGGGFQKDGGGGRLFGSGTSLQGRLGQPNNAQSQNQGHSVNEILTSIKQEMTLWDKSKMWPFSCYGYSKNIGSLPGLEDLSPEEVRLRAYEANKSGNATSYQQWIGGLANEYGIMRKKLENPDAALRTKLVSIIDNANQGTDPSKTQLSSTGSSVLNRNTTFGNNKPVFGASSVFGNSTAANGSASVFGGSSTTGQGATSSVFGNTQNTSQSVFGSGSGQSSNQSSVFGQQTQSSSVFGGTQNPSAAGAPSVFGGANTQHTTGQSVFGGSQTQQPTNQSVFGGSQPQQTTNQSVFGGSQPQQATNQSVFGGGQPQQTTGQSVFGGSQPQQPTNQSVFSGSQPQQPTNQSVFGGASQQPNQTVPGVTQPQPQPQQQSALGNIASQVTNTSTLSTTTPSSATITAPGNSQTTITATATQPAAQTGQPSTFSTFSFAPASQNQPATQPLGLFGKPLQPGASVFGASVSTGADLNKNWYTALDALTTDELEQFKADSFIPGKLIPIRPPPLELCQ